MDDGWMCDELHTVWRQPVFPIASMTVTSNWYVRYLVSPGTYSVLLS